MKEWNYRKPWFHGSPTLFDELLVNSTITQDRELARFFSHKPSIVTFDENGTKFHNGKINGYLYIVEERITHKDVYPHPNTTMKPGEEWLIKRTLKVLKLDETKILAKELLTDDDVKELLMKFENN